MKLIPYKEALKMTKTTMKKALAPLKAKKAKKRAELEMASIEENIATLESDIQELCKNEDIDFKRIISKLDDLGLAERKMGQFEKIIKEMFPEV